MHLSSSMNLAEKYRRSGHFEKKWRPIIPQFPAWINSLQLQPPCNHSLRPVPAKCVPIIGLLEGTCHEVHHSGLLRQADPGAGSRVASTDVRAWTLGKPRSITSVVVQGQWITVAIASRRSYASNEPKFPLLRFLFFFILFFPPFWIQMEKSRDEEKKKKKLEFPFWTRTL